MRIALDTNILAYAEGVNGDAMRLTALDLIGRLPRNDVVLPIQVLAELFNVLTRKASHPRDRARSILLSWRDSYALVETSVATLLSAADLAADHQVPIWDAVILSAAAESGCRLLLSQDFHDGFTWGGVTVTNPFSGMRHPLLEAFFGGPLQ